MHWFPLLVVLALFAVIFFTKRRGEISREAARRLLKNGALIIDVRTSGEFNSGHLENSINIPLDEIDFAVPKRVKNKNQALLLHCASGIRSGVARKRLNNLGYANAFNLGSFSRAKKILEVGAD